MRHLFYPLAVAVLVSCVTIENDIGGDDTTKTDIPEGILVHPTPVANPKNDDEYFFNYRLGSFAPDTEPFIEETFGSGLTFEEVGFWEHRSYTSCAVGFRTNLPTISVIQYGTTTAYGQQTVQSESYYYQHLHYIKGLEQDSTYHYRIIVSDHQGRIIVSDDHTFTTRILTPDIIRIPEDMEGSPPYTLTKGNATYVLTQDLTVPTLAINIKTSNVRLDLDGHTIVYDDGTPEVVGSWWNDYAYNERASFGIRTGLWNFANDSVLNGTIRQGRNGGTGFIGCGFNPLFLNHMLNSYNEVAGITVDYYGNSVGGMVTGDGNVHHNVLYDRGSVIDDRHMAVRAVSGGSNPLNIFAFNSLRRFRHRGVDSGGKVEYNELYSDSFDTNSFMLGVGANCQARFNKLFGMGYNPIGFGWANNLEVSNNFIYLRGFSPSQRSEEYGRKSAVAGMRITNYNQTPFENMLFEDNVIVLKAEDGCAGARGIWTSNSENEHNIVYRRNTVKVEAMPGNNLKPNDVFYNGDVNNAVAALTLNGGPGNGSESRPDPIIFEDNHFIGNVNLILVGEGYGIGNSLSMYRTKLEKIEHDSESFRPVRLGFWFWNALNNRMVDTECIGFDWSEMTPHFYGSVGKMEMCYGEKKSLKFTDAVTGAPLANRRVTLTVTEESGYAEAFQTNAGGNGTFDLLTVRHYKFGNSREHDGVAGEVERTDYRNYHFSVSGYKPFGITLEQLLERDAIALTPD
ncbi:MAG: hypothetical protein LBQ78_05070 [Tannerellaceae bacterium]|jgi:hypothetical protein|nr:hypothetical protein [Tannerellaceae bacterium]